MKTTAGAAMLAIVLLFAGMFMALMLFASKASWIMEGVSVPEARLELLAGLCTLFLSASAILTVIVVRSLAKIRQTQSDLDGNDKRDSFITN